MSLANTTTTPAFIEVTPDWTRPVFVLTRWLTPTQSNRESGEQRSRLKARPKLNLSYESRGFAPNDFVLNRVKAIQELGKAVVCPVWTEYGVAASFGTDSVDLSSAITSLKYKVDAWIYVVQGSNKCFRKVNSVVSPTINLSSAGADFYPVGFSWAVFSAVARVYPCIVGMKNDNSYRFIDLRSDRQDEAVSIEEL